MRAVPLVYHGTSAGCGAGGLDQEMVNVHFPKVKKIALSYDNLN